MEARASAAFVGRARELEELERALDAARAGSGATVLVAGEAGIGKTRLASELATRARDAGFEVLLGRSIDLVGTELPYQPFVEALRPLGELRRRRGRRARSCGCSRRRWRCSTERAAAAPVLLVLEDLHWADTSTLDLVVFLAHNLDDRRGPAARDLPRGRARVGGAHAPARRRRPALGLGARARARTARARGADGAARGSRRRAAAGGADRRDRRPLGGQPVLRRGAPRRRRRRRAASSRAACATCCCSASPGSTAATQSLLRLAAAAGRDVAYPLLRAAAALPGARRARVAAPGGRARRPRRRPGDAAASASATRCWPRRSTRRSCPASARSCTRGSPTSSRAAAPRRRRSSRRTGRRRVAARRRWPRRSTAAREAEAVFGLAEALAHLERALALWDAVPDAAELAGLDLAELCAWAAELASQTGAAPRAVELARRAIELVGDERPAARGAPARAPRRVPLREPAATTPRSPRSSARSSSCRREPPSPERA